MEGRRFAGNRRRSPAEEAIRVFSALRPDDGWLGEETGSAEGQQRLYLDCRSHRWHSQFCSRRSPVEHPGRLRRVKTAEGWCRARSGGRLRAVSRPWMNATMPPWAMAPVAMNSRFACPRLPPLKTACGALKPPPGSVPQGLEAVFSELEQNCALSRGLSDAYGHMLVASGRAELMVEPQLALWDVAATSLVVREAGGRFSDLDGREPGICSGHAVVSNGQVHAAALDIIRAGAWHDPVGCLMAWPGPAHFPHSPALALRLDKRWQPQALCGPASAIARDHAAGGRGRCCCRRPPLPEPPSDDDPEWLELQWRSMDIDTQSWAVFGQPRHPRWPRRRSPLPIAVPSALAYGLSTVTVSSAKPLRRWNPAPCTARCPLRHCSQILGS